MPHPRAPTSGLSRIPRFALAADILTATHRAIRWFWEPHTAAEYARESGQNHHTATRLVRGWAARGWLRSVGLQPTGGRLAEHFTFAHLPSIGELVRPRRPSGLPAPLPVDLGLEVFQSPATIREYADTLGIGILCARRRVLLAVREGRLHLAGEVQAPRGRPAQAYCIDERKAVLATVRRLLEYEARHKDKA